jgi:hypothetical protein
MVSRAGKDGFRKDAVEYWLAAESGGGAQETQP